MSVFATKPQTHYMRSLGFLLVIAVVVLGTVYFGKVIRIPLTATQLDAVLPSFSPLVARETTFPNPATVDWEGVIVGVMVSGRALAVKRSDTGELFQAYLASGASFSYTQGPVRIRGRLTAISCAYAHTVFNGRCTPSVEIESIEQLPIELE